MTPGDFILIVALLSGVGVAAWTAYRVGYGTAQREAFYTVSQLRRALRAEQLRADTLREQNRLLNDRLNRGKVIAPEVPQWMR